MSSCFVCKSSLSGKQFLRIFNRPCCLSCYENKYANDCKACGKKISAGQVDLVYNDAHWHQDCFVCSKCENVIENHHFKIKARPIKGTDVYCSKCYEDKVQALTCSKCEKVIASGYVMYKKQPVHTECFSCGGCGLFLAHKRYTIQNNQPYCVECFGKQFANRCTACALPIFAGRYIHRGENFWHFHCFRCSKCNKNVFQDDFITDEDGLLCIQCYQTKM